MQSQAACTYLLICPEFLDALKARKDCWREHTVLYIFGQAWMAYDRPRLTKEERIRSIELYEALLCFNMGGEQLYLPFQNETMQGANPGLKGILAAVSGSFLSSQNLLAFLSNSALSKRIPSTQYVYTTSQPTVSASTPSLSSIGITAVLPGLRSRSALTLPH